MRNTLISFWDIFCYGGLEETSRIDGKLRKIVWAVYQIYQNLSYTSLDSRGCQLPMLDIFLSGSPVYIGFLTAYVALSGSSYLSCESVWSPELPTVFRFEAWRDYISFISRDLIIFYEFLRDVNMQDTWRGDGFRSLRRMLLLLHGEMSRHQMQLAWKREVGGAGLSQT